MDPRQIVGEGRLQEKIANRTITTPMITMRSTERRSLRTSPPEFAEIYRAYFDRVCRWSRALGGPAADNDDLVQDVFLIVHRRLPDFDGNDVGGWLYQITRHRVRDFRRLRWFLLFLRSTQADESLPSSARGPEAELERKQQRASVSRLLSKLPEVQRAAFILFEIHGYSGERIARMQGVPINTVWSRIRNARTSLAANVARLCRVGCGRRFEAPRAPPGLSKLQRNTSSSPIEASSSGSPQEPSPGANVKVGRGTATAAAKSARIRNGRVIATA